MSMIASQRYGNDTTCLLKPFDADFNSKQLPKVLLVHSFQSAPIWESLSTLSPANVSNMDSQILARLTLYPFVYKVCFWMEIFIVIKFTKVRANILLKKRNIL